MSILNLSKRGSAPPEPSHEPAQRKLAMSFDPATLAAAVLCVGIVIAGAIACLVYVSHAGTAAPTHHYQCVDTSGQPANDSECRRPVVPPIVSPVFVP
jgi:hypothetical protein